MDREARVAQLAADVVDAARDAGLTISCAESLTGGLLGATIVGAAGASDVFRGGAITYATQTKADVLGVSHRRLDAVGPVDEVVAEQMAEGCARIFSSDVGISTTGVAGPGPSDGHDAGTVWIGVSHAGESRGVLHAFDGDRLSVRYTTVEAALSLLLREISRIRTKLG